MSHHKLVQNFLPVYSNPEEYEEGYWPGNGMSGLPYDEEPLQEESQLQELLNLLYAGRWLIAGSFLVVLVLTVFYTFTRIPVYQAHSLVLLDNRVAPDLKDALDAGPNSRGASSRSVETEVYVLQRSLGVSNRVGTRLLDYKTDPVTGKPLSILADSLPVDHLAMLIQDRISIYREPVEEVLRISASSVEPWEARLLADLYAEEFVNHALGRSRSRLAATRFFLENEADERHRELKALEAQMQHFMDQNHGLTLNDGTATLVSQVAELDALRDEIALEIQMKGVLIQDLIQNIQEMGPQLLKQGQANLPQKIEHLQEEIAGIEEKLNQIYLRNPHLRNAVGGTNDQTIITYENEKARIETMLASLTEDYIEQIVVFGEASAGSLGSSAEEFGRLQRQLSEEKSSIKQLGARRRIVEKQLATYQVQLEELPAQAIMLTQLQRSISTTERAYLLLKEKLEDVRISEESEQGYAEIILKAEMPFRPDFPDKPKNMILGGLLGVLLGLGLAVIRQQFYKNIIVSPHDIRKAGYRLLGVVPSMKQFVKEQFRGVKLVERNGYLNDSCLISLQPPASFVSDAYTRFRFNIHGVHGEEDVQVILVTSPNPEEGKSITALNLAIANAQAGKRTVIVDTDLRRPSIHTKLGIESKPGFTEMMAVRKLQFRKALTHLDNLYVLTAGTPAENSSELLTSREMPHFIKELKRLFDVVILDSPPYMLVSDPLILSTLCDGTVIVTSAGKTKVDELHQGMHELQKVGGRVLGVLLNEFDPSELFGARTKYKYYRYTNHYSYHKQADALLQS